MNRRADGPVLSVRGLNIRFGQGAEEVSVVDGFNLDLGPGEIVGLVGESGCGKSLTGAALLGMVPQSASTCRAQSMCLGSQDLCNLDEAGWRRIRGRNISMIFQDPLAALDPVFSIGSQLRGVIRRHRQCERGGARSMAAELIRSVGLADPEATLLRYPHQLSGGMRQRVMIAMAMSCRPLVMVADEPTTALDATTQGQILEQIHGLARSKGMAVLLITHDLSVVAQVCDRAIVMYCGRVVEEGKTIDLFHRPRHPYTAGLLAAMPKITSGPVQPVQAIPGTVPQPRHMPAGCRFHPRCTHADTRCHSEVPGLFPVYSGATMEAGPASPRLACHHPIDTRDGA